MQIHYISFERVDIAFYSEKVWVQVVGKVPND